MFASLLAGALLGILSWILTSIIYYGSFDLENSGIHNWRFYSASICSILFRKKENWLACWSVMWFQ
jgi:hypothetical protein